MSSENTEEPDRLTIWLVGGSLVVALAVAIAAFAWSWPTQAVGNGLQLLGITLTTLGVAVVRSWLQLAADKAIDAKHGLKRWWALTEERLRTWWAHLHRRGVHLERFLSDTVSVSDSASVRKQHYAPVHPEARSDRQWLLHLDQHLHALYEIVDKAQLESASELSRRLAEQRDELRAEIQRETRQAGSSSWPDLRGRRSAPRSGSSDERPDGDLHRPPRAAPMDRPRRQHPHHDRGFTPSSSSTAPSHAAPPRQIQPTGSPRTR